MQISEALHTWSIPVHSAVVEQLVPIVPVGWLVGCPEGCPDGALGWLVGCPEGCPDGALGWLVGWPLGWLVG